MLLQQPGDLLHAPWDQGDLEFGEAFGLLADRGVQLGVLEVERGRKVER